jgi:hypothetical protein
VGWFRVKRLRGVGIVGLIQHCVTMKTYKCQP